jgi:hypothetical protein
MNDTLALCVADAYVRVTDATFGHLKPKPQTEYTGYILFTKTSFRETCIIDFEFENLTESPWFNNDILDLISEYTKKLPKDKYFGVFKWNGTYKKFKNGNFKFKGDFSEIKISTAVE